jgi:hypothetical protein
MQVLYHLGHTPSPYLLFYAVLFLFFMALGFELGASHVLGRTATTWAPPPAQLFDAVDW